MRAVKSDKYMYRRGDNLVFRRAVPEHAIAAFGGRREVHVSLGTSDVKLARALLPREVEKFEKVLATLKGQRSPAEIALQRRPANETEIARGVRRFFAERMERVRQLDPSDPQSVDQAKRLRTDLQQYRLDLRQSRSADTLGWSQNTIWMAQAIQEHFGWELAGGLQLSLLHLVTRAQLEATEQQLQMLGGHGRKAIDETFSPERFQADAEIAIADLAARTSSLASLLERYINESDLAPATVKSYRRQFGVFQKYIDHDDARSVTKKDVVNWKDHLLAAGGSSGKPLAPKSVSDTYLTVLKAVFQWGVDNDELDTNPAAGVRVRQARAMQVRPSKGLTDQEAVTILRATLVSPTSKLTARRALAQRWVPWICAYTGARVNEITQLRSKDIALRDGIWTIHITPEAGSTKDGKARTVAIHPHLIEQGLPEMAAQADGPLFYDPSLHRGGSAANPQFKKVGEHLADWVRSIGVDDAHVQPNHGWRHRFKTLARNHRLKMDVVDYIQGHAPGSVAQTYGDVTIAATLREIALLPRYEWNISEA